MSTPFRFFIVDDDPVTIGLLTKLLEARGHTVTATTTSAGAISQILALKPDCVLLDIMMPDIDGLELCKQLRGKHAMEGTRIVMVSGKTYEFDRMRAYRFGADGYIMKPIDPEKFAPALERIIEDRIALTFWGVRGTLPVPGKRSIKFGGNTSCVSLGFAGGQFFIFDAGTGIKELSDYLLAENLTPMEAKIFISHPHWDHINALPFFSPLYRQGNEFEICGPAQGDLTMHEIISGQMDGVHFPIKIKEFSASVRFRDLKEERFDVGGIQVRTMLLNHPGHCLGFRVEYKGRSVCYITDNELYPESSPHFSAGYQDKLIEFIHRADALIADSTYTEEEYDTKIAWGHSSIIQVADLADKAQVKTFYLFHHDPDQTDVDIQEKLKAARHHLKGIKSKTGVIAPKEKQVFWL